MTKRVCRSSAVLVFTVVAWLLTLFVLTDRGWAEGKKIAGTAKFGPTLSQTLLLPTDVPKHEVMLINRVQTWNSTDPEWNNVEVTQFVFSDYIAGSGYHHLRQDKNRFPLTTCPYAALDSPSCWLASQRQSMSSAAGG